jgi:hypothetical protein
MSEKIVNALAQMKQVYLEEVGHNDLEQKRINEECIQINEFKKLKLDPVGEEDSDVDNDGDVDSSDRYLKNRRNVVTREVNSDLEKEILKAMKRLKKGGTPNSDESADNVEKIMRSISGLRPPVKENVYYSWRDDVDESLLWEIIDELEQKQVKEKKVNNYSGKDPVVSVNPEMKTESVLLDSEELGEDFIEEAIDIATEYLCEEGLSDQDVEELIDELGVEEFSEWVMQLGYETLLEWRRGPDGSRISGSQVSKSGKHISTLKGGAKASAIRATPEHKRRKEEREREPPSTPSGMTSALKSRAQVAKKPDNKDSTPVVKKLATSPENIRSTQRGALDTVARGVLSATKGHQRAMEIRKKGGTLAQQLGGGAVAAIGSFIKKGTSHFKEWVDNLLEEGYDLSGYTWDELYEEYEDLQEKAVSEQQQKIFGLALSVKRGETPRSKVSDKVLEIVDSMSEKEIRKYAKTSHEGIPKTVNESFLVEKVIDFVRNNH